MYHMWSLAYLEPLNVVIVDQDTAYTSKNMRKLLKINDVQLKEATMKTPCAIANVRRCHAPLRLAYERIGVVSSRGTTNKECLDLTVFAIKCTVGPEELFAAMLVFAASPRSLRMNPAPTQLERAPLVNNAMKKVENEQARKKISFVLRHNGLSKPEEWFALLR